MYQAKIPAVTAEIERRIRRGIYDTKLPPVVSLQQEFSVARQTITDSVKLLAQRGIVKTESRRGGVRICRENLCGGTLLIISRSDCRSLLTNLSKEIKADGLTPRNITLSKSRMFRSEIPDDLRGVLFVNSALTVEWAEFLIQKKIPLVSCNQLFSSPQVDMFDFDLEYDINFLVQSLIARGYRRIALFYSGFLEGFNDYFWRIFRKIKRRYALPCESYDDIPVQWEETPHNKLIYTFTQMQKKKQYPEVMLSFFAIRDLIPDAIAKSGIKLPGNFQFVILRPHSQPIPETVPGISTFYMKSPMYPLWSAGYSRLRELMFSPQPQKPCLQLLRRELCFDGEVPVTQSFILP